MGNEKLKRAMVCYQWIIGDIINNLDSTIYYHPSTGYTKSLDLDKALWDITYFIPKINSKLMHLSSAFPGWGTPRIPGGIATFYAKVTQFSEPSGMIWRQTLHPGEIRNMLTEPHVNRDNGSHPLTPENVPNPRARKRPRRPERPRYWGALFFNFSWFPPGSPGSPFPGRPMASALRFER